VILEILAAQRLLVSGKKKDKDKITEAMVKTATSFLIQK
jgi:hypothetical protein